VVLDGHEEEFELLEMEMDEYEEKIEEFQDRLAEELVKDGYLENSDQRIRFEMKNGKAKANGKNIKKEHLKRYEEIYESIFGKPFRSHFILIN